MVRKPPSFWRLDKSVFRVRLYVGDMNDLALQQGSSRCRAPLGNDWQISDILREFVGEAVSLQRDRYAATVLRVIVP